MNVNILQLFVWLVDIDMSTDIIAKTSYVCMAMYTSSKMY